MKKIIAVVLMMMLLVSCSSKNNVDATNEKISSIVTRFNEALMNSDYDSLCNDFVYTKEMKKFMTKKKLEKIIVDLKADKVIEQKESFETKKDGFIIISTPTVFESAAYNVNLVFDDKNRITGFRFGKFTDVEVTKENTNEIPLDAQVNDLTLSGVLTKPSKGDKFPCVILVHGSGPSDKDETIFQNKPFRDIAHGLAELGVATYRYDKRVYAYPKKFMENHEFTLYEETIDDAVEITKMIKDREDISEVYVLGHSLGGHAIPLIAQRLDAAGYIIMAGNVRKIDELMAEQIDYLINFDNKVTNEEKAYQEGVNKSIEMLKDLDNLDSDQVVLGAYKPYWEFMNSYDPIEVSKKIEKPVLVLQGERDYQVTMKDFELWKNVNKENWTYKSYEKLNHIMMPGEGKSSNQEYAQKNTVSDEVIKDIAEWIKSE